MKVAVVDDDVRMFETLRGYFSDYLGDSATLTHYASGEEFLRGWHSGDFDLLILDIFMSGCTGLQVAREVRKTDPQVRLVFSTSSNEFASESYEVNACYYLHKPFGKERVKAMLDRIDLAEMERLRSVKLPDGTGILLRSILYVDCAAHCVTLHKKGGETVVARETFAEIERLLCAYPYFFSPTRGVIVNFYEVEEQGQDTFHMSDGRLVPISRRRAKEALDAYSSFLFAQLRKGGGA